MLTSASVSSSSPASVGSQTFAGARFAIIEAPSILGLFPKGVETLPDAMLAAGIANALSARRAGRVHPPAYSAIRDPVTQLLNPDALANYSSTLANAVGAVLDSGEFPVVLGGDCSILLGNLLALKRRGRYGLLFLDGHADFYQPAVEPHGEAASMELGFVIGKGPSIVADLEQLGPLVREEDVVMLGRRDAVEAERNGSQDVRTTAIDVIDLVDVQKIGATDAALRAMNRLATPNTQGIWIHLDADVLNDAIMPAVDYRMPDGLSWTDLVAILRVARETGRARGINITIFNPKLDHDGAIATAFVNALAEGLCDAAPMA